MHPLAGTVLVKELNLAARSMLVSLVDDLADHDVVDTAQQRPFALDFASGKVQLAECAGQPVRAIRDAGVLLRQPGMLETFVDRDAPFRVDGEHAIDEVEGRVADAVPVGGRVVEHSHFDLIRQVVRVLR